MTRLTEYTSEICLIRSTTFCRWFTFGIEIVIEMRACLFWSPRPLTATMFVFVAETA